MTGFCEKECRNTVKIDSLNNESEKLSDLLFFIVKGIAVVNTSLRSNGIGSKDADRFIPEALYVTVTNTNFQSSVISDYINSAVRLKSKLISEAEKNGIPLPEYNEVGFSPEFDEYTRCADKISLDNEDFQAASVKSVVACAVRGAASYVYHVWRIGYESDDIYELMQLALTEISDPLMDENGIVRSISYSADCCLRAISFIDMANIHTFGEPEQTWVNLEAGNNPGILVSGHDLKDLEDLLKQSRGKGIDIYTHSDLMPANCYHKLKKYKHFVGNYGNSWWRQQEDFDAFNGPILMTSNCLIVPKGNYCYVNRLYTTNTAGCPGATHILAYKKWHKKSKDFSEIIEHAKNCRPPEKIDHGTVLAGFSHHQLLDRAEIIAEKLSSGMIKKIVMIAGCDGNVKLQNYFTGFARSLPYDNIVITAGCVKFRFNKYNFGEIDGIPRIIDVGQCNDVFSIILFANKLTEVCGMENINDLPIEYHIAWSGQKAITLMMAFLSRGIRKIHIGPSTEGFIPVNVIEILNCIYGQDAVKGDYRSMGSYRDQFIANEVPEIFQNV
ncbi:MAG: hydroxylamine reductase [Rikenellaceae bacterium]|nr:hydroxylamine reductase [Rikenellaceae bacterium]